MRKILHKLLFVALLVSGSAIYSQTALPGTIQVESGDVSNNQTSGGTLNVIGSGNGGTNNIITKFRKNAGVDATIINHVSVASDGNYDFEFTLSSVNVSTTLPI